MPTAFSRAAARVQVRATSCPLDGKLSLKADEPQVGPRQEYVEGKLEYYHIIFPMKRLEMMILSEVFRRWRLVIYPIWMTFQAIDL